MILTIGNLTIHCWYCSLCRGKIGYLAIPLPNCLLVSRNCNSFDSYRRGDDETVFPDCLWAPLFIESPNNSRVVSGVYFSMHCSISAPKPQFYCWTFPRGGCDSHHLFHHGLGSLCKPTKATHNILWTPSNAVLCCFCLLHNERTWDRCLCFQRPQFSSRDSGMHSWVLKGYKFIFFFTLGTISKIIISWRCVPRSSNGVYLAFFRQQCHQHLSTQLMCQCGEELKLPISLLQCVFSLLQLEVFGRMETL